jgi:hypothetical protein
MVFRLYFRKQGGHVHCRLFTAPGIHLTFAKCGDLVFRENEWLAARSAFESIGEVLEDR